jgi:hypothetical protein
MAVRERKVAIVAGPVGEASFVAAQATIAAVQIDRDPDAGNSGRHCSEVVLVEWAVQVATPRVLRTAREVYQFGRLELNASCRNSASQK